MAARVRNSSYRSSGGAGLGVALVATALLGTSALVPDADATRRAKKHPDLVVTQVGSPAKGAPGKSFKVSTKVKNKGKTKAGTGKSKLVVVLSRDRKKPGSDKRVGSRGVGALKPGKTSTGKVSVKVPKSAKGRYFLIACVTGVKGERGKAAKNNCRTASRAITIKASAPRFPEKFVGTATATHTYDLDSSGHHQGFTYQEASTVTMSAEAVFTRVAKVGGGYDYVSSGEIEYSWRKTDSGTGPGGDSACTVTADGETVIGPFRTTRYASATLNLRNRSTSFAPGSSYQVFSSWDFAGFGEGPPTKLPALEECSGGDWNSSGNYPFDLAQGWLPPASYKCDAYPTPKLHQVNADGSLSGNELCTRDAVEHRTNGATQTIHSVSHWVWSFEPASD